jgi:beta-phosphoglucomutase
MGYQGILFDLDGVIVSTDEYHYRAWKQLADTEGIPFDRVINDRLRGVSRMESLKILLEPARRSYSEEEMTKMAAWKNEAYRKLIGELSPEDILPGAMEFMEKCRRDGILMAIGSSSKNARFILGQIGLGEYFDAVVDGTDIRRSKPDPEVFTLGAERLGLDPTVCLVVEDADAGVDAGLAGGMDVLAVGAATAHPKATYKAKDLQEARVLWPLG